jgi:hypothetical protein
MKIINFAVAMPPNYMRAEFCFVIGHYRDKLDVCSLSLHCSASDKHILAIAALAVDRQPHQNICCVITTGANSFGDGTES